MLPATVYPRVAWRIDAVAEGNPFYAREIFRHLVEEQKILLRAGRWSTDVSTRELEIPEEDLPNLAQDTLKNFNANPGERPADYPERMLALLRAAW